jgi:hypothetical protein
MALRTREGASPLFANGARVAIHPSFCCTYCSGWYDDGRPLVTITGGNAADELYCSDECAYAAGWSRAVVARWKLEAERGDRFITYARPEYLARLVS